MATLTPGLLLPPLLLILYFVQKYFGRLRPLNAIPSAHPTAFFSSIWLLSIRYRKRENRTVWEAHKRLGPVVRLAPEEVSVCTLEGLKTIYGDWEKNAWYEAFINYGTPPLVSKIHSGPHSAHKRLFSNVYSKSYVQNSLDISTFNSRILTQKVFPKIAASVADGASIDVLRLNMAFSMDTMSAYEFGSAYGTDFLDDEVACRRFLAAFAVVKNGFFWAGRLPTMTQNLERIGISLVAQEALDGQAYMEEMCWKLCSRVHTAIETNSLEPTSTVPVVYAQRLSSQTKSMEKTPPSPSDDPDFLRKSVASDMLCHLIAGHETSGIALTYAMYELSMHPEFQTALRTELRLINPPLIFPPSASGRSAFSTSIVIPPSAIPRALDALPLLNATLYETLRLYPPGAAGQPRVVPRGGAMLHGFTLPEGVVAHAAPYSVHRNEEVFERAEEWLPERWMGERKKEVGEWFWSFGSGSSGCIGKAFAVQGECSAFAPYVWFSSMDVLIINV
jgi:unspecific monooxygenase